MDQYLVLADLQVWVSELVLGRKKGLLKISRNVYKKVRKTEGVWKMLKERWVKGRQTKGGKE